MGAVGSQAGIALTKEVVWGVKPEIQFTGTNFVSENMSFGITNEESKNVRPDRQTSELVQVGAECGGGFETEFQAANVDAILPAVLMDTDWHAPPAGESVVFTIETAGGVGGLMTVADSSVFSVGQVVQINGSVSNDGFHTVKTIVDATNVQLTAPLVTETSVAVVFAGHYIRNGVTQSSFSIERSNNDISQFFLYRGMVPSTLEMSIESGSPVSANFSFVGKDEVLQQTQHGSTDPISPSTNPIMNAVSSIGEVAIDGVELASCLLQKVGFTLDNKVEGKTGVGVLGFCFAVAKSIGFTGNISMYFNDETYYEKYLASTAFGLSFTLTDPDNNSYIIQIPQCKFDKVTSNVSGKDDDVMLDGTYVAIVSPTTGYTIQITRILT